MWEEQKDKITEMHYNKQYVSCLQYCFQVLKQVEVHDKWNYDILYFCYYKIATLYSCFGKFELSIKYAKKAKLYTETIFSRICVNWTFSCCYHNININKSIKYIDFAIKDLAEKLENKEYLFQALVHKAWITNDEKMMEVAIANSEIYTLDKYRLDELYQDQFEVYINKNNILAAKRVINKISDKDFKVKLNNRLIQMVRCG